MSYVGSTSALAKLDDMILDKENNSKVGTEKKNRKLSKILADDYMSSKNLPQTANQPKDNKKLDVDEKVIITGDDILIEYVKRSMELVKKMQNAVSS
jgi:hypothetical protein